MKHLRKIALYHRINSFAAEILRKPVIKNNPVMIKAITRLLSAARRLR